MPRQREPIPARADVLVVGLGAMGSACLYHLAQAGITAAGVDRLEPPHSEGSTHGSSRIIREAYFEHPLYVPLVQRSYQLWAQLEEAAGIPLYRRTGALMLGPPEGALLSGSLQSCTMHGIPHRLLTTDEIHSAWPGLTPRPGVEALWEERAGLLRPEAAVTAHLELARAAGARVVPRTEVRSWSASAGGVQVVTTRGTIQVGQVIMAAGPWLPALVPGLPLEVERQWNLWFRPRPGSESLVASTMPVVLVEHEPGGLFYAAPDPLEGLKAGIHHEGAAVTPENVIRTVTRAEEGRLRGLLDAWMPGANGPLVRGQVCLYTNTPDRHFLVDRLPGESRILVVSPCSGHGFKFAPAIGELVRDLVMDRAPDFDPGPFRLERLLQG